MKFAHGFKETLAKQDFPEHWVKQAIPYSQLKKCLKKVQQELEDLGLDASTLRSLSDPENTSPVALQYKLKSSGTNVVQPKLTVLVHLHEGEVIDASLTDASRQFIEKLTAEIRPESKVPLILNHEPTVPQPQIPENLDIQRSEQGTFETIEVPLVFDSQFFDLLQSDVNKLEVLQADEEKNLMSEVIELGNEVSQVSKPSRFSKSDLARWREIFELYLDAGVFFATMEQDHGARSSKRALQQLQWFQGEVEKRRLAQNFKLSESRVAFSRFVKLNASLLKNLQFQELNRLAVSKILKKFDKRTALGVSKAFPDVAHSEKLLFGNIAKDVCAEMSQRLMSVVPQINDYLCPICFAVAYRPVRLDCQHVFCIRCVIKIQRRGERHCPLCRAEVVMNASADNLDRDLEKYMRKYFPKEVKEKQKANDIERGIEDYGASYKPQQCSIM